MREDFNQDGIDALASTGRPIPGQSLTNDPDAGYPWERPPEFTDFREALHYITDGLLEPDVFLPLMEGISGGVPLTDIALQLLQKGFQEGKWNPDLLMLLVEPTIYVLMTLAEKVNIEYRITGDEEEDLTEEDEQEVSVMAKNNLSKLAEERAPEDAGVPAGGLPKSVVEQIAEAEIPESLLARPQPSPEEGVE